MPSVSIIRNCIPTAKQSMSIVSVFFSLIYNCQCEFQRGPRSEFFYIWTIVEFQDLQILLVDTIMANINPCLTVTWCRHPLVHGVHLRVLLTYWILTTCCSKYYHHHNFIDSWDLVCYLAKRPHLAMWVLTGLVLVSTIFQVSDCPGQWER